MKKVKYYILTITAYIAVICAIIVMNVSADYISEHEKNKAKITVVQEKKMFKDVPLSTKEQDEIIDTCYEYGVDSKLLFSIGYVESGFQNIRSYSGKSHGIWQINPASCQDYIWQGCDLYDPVDNAIVAIQVLAYWQKEYSDMRCVLMAYNKGYDQSSWSEWYANKVIEVYQNLN